MKRLLSALGIGLLAGCAGETLRDDMREPYGSIPRSVGDFRVQGEDERYDRETLFNYIDGGAELYLTYDFQEAFVRRFVHADQPETELVLDVYDMGSPEEAYGVFSCEREDEDAGIGQGSEYGGGLLRFWKDRFFVSIVALGDEATSKPSIMELGREVADAVPSTGSAPALVELLPKDGLRDIAPRYFHTMHCLNNQYFLASENILNLGVDTDCTLARYERGNETGLLLFIRYPDEGQSREGYESFLSRYMPEARDTGVAQMENHKWTSARQVGRDIAIVFEAHDESWASGLLTDLPFGGR